MTTPERFSREFSRHAIPQLCTARDVAVALDVRDAETVRRHLRTGRLPGRKLGGRWIVERDQLLEFLRPAWVSCADCAHWVTAESAVRSPAGLAVCRECSARLPGCNDAAVAS